MRGRDPAPHLCVPAPQCLQPLPGQLLLLPLPLLQKPPDSVAELDGDRKVGIDFSLGKKGRAVRPEIIT